jgi:hypothetical protein
MAPVSGLLEAYLLVRKSMFSTSLLPVRKLTVPGVGSNPTVVNT